MSTTVFPNLFIKLHVNQVLTAQNLQKLNVKLKNSVLAPPEFAPPPLVKNFYVRAPLTIIYVVQTNYRGFKYYLFRLPASPHQFLRMIKHFILYLYYIRHNNP